MHLLLGGLLVFGIRWQSSPPAAVQAELWSAVPQTAAPAPRAVPPPPRVETPRPEPRPDPKPEPAPEPPKMKVDIAEKAPPVRKVEPKKEPVKLEAPKPKPVVQPPTPKAEPKPKPEAAKTPPKRCIVLLMPDALPISAGATALITATGTVGRAIEMPTPAASSASTSCR